ncbi:MAG: hypothetical protein JWM78_1576 [Verrucomicrobiaceae bacterium]|nr:hypothetical protein [Verrucomicrobiaceae bacterium]
MYVDWHTDENGEFHLGQFFAVFRQFGDRPKLEAFKADLEAANDAVTAVELAETLSELDPRFEKFREVIGLIPAGAIPNFISVLLQIITLVVTIQAWSSSDGNHNEDVQLQQQQFQLSREQFEYQKQQDAKKAKEQEEIERRINNLQAEFNQKMQEISRHGAVSLESDETNSHRSLKGALRNKPCPCGSGLKAKKCHPAGC